MGKYNYNTWPYRKGTLWAEEREGWCHGEVLVLDGELARLGVRLDDRGGHHAAVGGVGLTKQKKVKIGLKAGG